MININVTGYGKQLIEHALYTSPNIWKTTNIFALLFLNAHIMDSFYFRLKQDQFTAVPLLFHTALPTIEAFIPGRTRLFPVRTVRATSSATMSQPPRDYL